MKQTTEKRSSSPAAGKADTRAQAAPVIDGLGLKMQKQGKRRAQK